MRVPSIRPAHTCASNFPSCRSCCGDADGSSWPPRFGQRPARPLRSVPWTTARFVAWERSVAVLVAACGAVGGSPSRGSGVVGSPSTPAPPPPGRKGEELTTLLTACTQSAVWTNGMVAGGPGSGFTAPSCANLGVRRQKTQRATQPTGHHLTDHPSPCQLLLVCGGGGQRAAAVDPRQQSGSRGGRAAAGSGCGGGGGDGGGSSGDGSGSGRLLRAAEAICSRWLRRRRGQRWRRRRKLSRRVPGLFPQVLRPQQSGANRDAAVVLRRPVHGRDRSRSFPLVERTWRENFG